MKGAKSFCNDCRYIHYATVEDWAVLRATLTSESIRLPVRSWGIVSVASSRAEPSRIFGKSDLRLSGYRHAVISPIANEQVAINEYLLCIFGALNGLGAA